MIHAVLIWLLAAQTPVPLPAAPSQAEQAIMDRVWTALHTDRGLANLHRGYLAYLQGNAAVAGATDALDTLLASPGFRAAEEAFDDVLAADAGLEAQFDAYYVALAGNETARSLVSALDALEAEEPALRDSGGEGLDALKADPAKALRFLGQPAGAAGRGEGFRRLAERLSSRPGVRAELLRCFEGLDRIAEAHASVFPWWKTLANLQPGARDAYQAWRAHAIKHPLQYRVWDRYQLAVAADPQARDWLRYWRRRVRRHAALADTYRPYLAIIRTYPAYGRAALDALEQRYGPAPQWPPRDEPPPLPASTRDRPAGNAARMTETAPGIERPAKPDAPFPAMPKMPTMPRKPEKPAREMRPAGDAAVKTGAEP